jgi:chitinase
MQKICATYYPEWAVYKGPSPRNLPYNKLTHVHFAFGKPSEDGDLVLPDIYIKRLHAEFKEAKAKYPGLKVILSVGGCKGSQYFSKVACDDVLRTKFVKSARVVLETYGFHGIDIDWEHPMSELESESFVTLIKELRKELPVKYELSVAINPLPFYTKFTKPSVIAPYVTYITLMCYDFSGPWSKATLYQSNIYTNNGDFKNSVERCISKIVDTGVEEKKLVLGCPLYGRTFKNTEGLKDKFETSDTVVEYKNINDSDATQYTVGYNYNLSKRTKVYTYYTRINNSNGISYLNGGSTISSLRASGGAGKDFSSFAVGIRHNF